MIDDNHDCLLTLIPLDCGKSTGIRLLLDHFSIDKRLSYAFGDGFNDVDMLNAVEYPIAMENGDNNLKDIAKCISLPPDKDGIDRVLKALGF